MNGRDPGLQPERTVLAWRRTALGLIANAVLLLASGVQGSDVRLGLGIVVAVIALGCWAAAGAAYRSLWARRKPDPDAIGSIPMIRLATGIVLAVGTIDLYAVLTA